MVLKYFVHPVISLGFIAGAYYQIDWPQNLAAFSAWVITVIAFICLPMDSGQILSKVKESTLNKVLFFISLASQVATGWIVTAAFGLIAWACLWIKKEVYKQEIQSKG